MFYLISLFMGVVISIMVAVNGNLTARYGLHSATIIIHIVGLILITAIVIIKRERFFPKRFAWFLYLGGATGVLTVLFNNIAFGRISVSAIMALGLFGQGVSGLLIDQYGLFGMKKHPFSKQKIFGFLLILAGILYMINTFETVAVIVSFFAGVTIVLSRTFNAKLADATSVRVSTFYNYLVGLTVAVLIFLLLGRAETGDVFGVLHAEFVAAPRLFVENWHIYLGGVLGVVVVLLSNVVVVKISALYLTLLIFAGTIFSGVVIDVILTGEFSMRNVIGGVLVTTGLCINLLLDRKKLLVE